MTDFTPQSTDRLPGDVSPDTYRVLYRGRIRVNSSDFTLSGSWYSYSTSVDLGQFKYATLPMLEFYVNNGTVFKAPYTQYSAAGAVAYSAMVQISAGSKSGSQSTSITFTLGGVSALQTDIYYQVMSLPAAGSLFP